MSKPWNKLIVALDLKDKAKIKKIIKALKPQGVKFKIGSLAFTKFGPDFIRQTTKGGHDVFLDLKLYDIPNTMRETAAVIAQMKVWAFTVHIKAGKIALCAVGDEVRKVCQKQKMRKPLVLGVTELTSRASKRERVVKLAAVAKAAGLDGVIASAKEAALIKKKFPELKVITPGIRNQQDKRGDQCRVATAKEAFLKGADYIVVGRPIISQKDYLKAAQDLLKNA